MQGLELTTCINRPAHHQSKTTELYKEYVNIDLVHVYHFNIHVIVNFMGFFLLLQQGTLYNELETLIKTGDHMREVRVIHIFRAICEGLRVLHSLRPTGLAHRYHNIVFLYTRLIVPKHTIGTSILAYCTPGSNFSKNIGCPGLFLLEKYDLFSKHFKKRDFHFEIIMIKLGIVNFLI